MTEVLIHSVCVVLTEDCKYVSPIKHDGDFDVYDLDVGKQYWVGCGKMTYKILVHSDGYEFVEAMLIPIDNYCKEVMVHE